MSNAFWQVWLGQSANSNPVGSGADASVNSNVLKQSYINRFLDVSGTLTVRYDASINGNLYLGARTKFGLGVGAPTYTLDQSGTHRIQCPNSSLATTKPDANPGNNGLVLTSTKASGGTNFSMGLGIDYTTGNGYLNMGYNSGTSSAQPFVLQATGGDVGIGTTTPTAALYVVGNQNINGTVTGAGGSNYNAGAFYTGGNTVASFVNAVTINSGVTNAAVVEIGSLNRDILSSAAENVTYKYALAYHTNTTGGDFEIKAIPSGATYSADGTPVSRMYITASGNIGMGTVRPQYNLDVSGSARFTSDVSINGNLVVGGALSVQQMQSKNVINTTTTNYQLIVSEDLSLNGRLFVSGDASLNRRLYVSGNVGIGTTAPAQLLDITNTAGAANIRLCSAACAGYITSGYNVGVNSYVGIHSGINTTSALGTPQFVVSENSYVGIGTTSPTSMMHINSGQNNVNVCRVVQGTNHYTQATDAVADPLTIVSTSNNLAMGLGVDTTVRGAYINCAEGGAVRNLYLMPRGGNVYTGTATLVNSDIRIKKNIQPLDKLTSLEVLRNLKPCSFEYINENSTSKDIGYIAQDINNIDSLRSSINIEKHFIPNIYANAIHDPSSNIITLESPPSDYVVVGDLIEYADVASEIATRSFKRANVTSIVSPTQFAIDASGETITNIFVYGKLVNDFMYLKKDNIFALHTSATQQLDTIVQSQQTQIQDLQTQLATVLARLSAAGIA